MSFVVGSLLSLYFSSLLAFSFVTHPINYCFLLLLGALSVVCCGYVIVGFSWYLVLFCLVYVGGIYVLFVFVSLHNPNPSQRFSGDLELLFMGFFIFWVFFVTVPLNKTSSYVEFSHYLCSFFEGFSYCFFCLVLMIGFVVISVVSGDKDSFCR